MRVKQFQKIKRIFFIGVFILIACALIFHCWVLAFFVLAGYLVLMSLLKTRVEGVVVDERQSLVAGQAAQVSFQILLPILLLISVILLMAGGNQEWHYLQALGVIFAYITCLGCVIYAVTYWYFNRKTGGC